MLGSWNVEYMPDVLNLCGPVLSFDNFDAEEYIHELKYPVLNL